MINSIDHFLSRSSKNMKRSPVREILKLLNKPGMISFAGGLPAPETFPVDDLKKITLEVLEKEGASALQYGTTEGDPLLRQLLAEKHNREGLSVGIENIIITTGSQQALDLIARVLIDPDDYILCGLPSYLGGINAFLAYGAKLKGIPLDDHGMKPDDLEKAVNDIQKQGKRIKFLYTIPDFQNPAGITLPEERRLKIIEIAEKYDFFIIEDSPYREIRFEGKPEKMMYGLDTSGRVITLSTFSKIFAPGFRIGWVLGHPLILDKLVLAKQTSDICSSAFSQRIIARYLEKGLLEKNLPKTIALYRERRDFMLNCFTKYMPGEISWTRPEGGLFLFVTMPAGLNAASVLKKAIDENVAFVDGSTFFCNDQGHNTMRINFSYSNKDEIETGVERLARVIKNELKSN
jgi:2-aminoadipate transaminase